MELPAMGSTQYGAAMSAATPMAFLNSHNALGMQTLDWNNQINAQRMLASVAMPAAQAQPKKETIEMADATTRLVKVFIVDADQNIPLDKRLIYRGDEVVTDLTDQELFFDIDISGLLKKHNDFRVTVEDKKANKDKPVTLEAARVRDLKMQVIVLAQF